VPTALLAPAKAAAHARLVGLAQRDSQRLGTTSDETPSALQTLDPVRTLCCRWSSSVRHGTRRVLCFLPRNFKGAPDAGYHIHTTPCSKNQLARTVSLSEDDRIIARARKEVLAAQKKMAHMSLFKGSSTTKQVFAPPMNPRCAPPLLERASMLVVLPPRGKGGGLTMWPDRLLSQAAKKPVVKPSVELHRAVEAHFGLVYSEAATPKELQGRVTMLAKGPKAESSSGDSKQMMLAERDNTKLERSQAKAAGVIKNFAATLLSSQRKAADELHELEKHFGR
jgi:hypothetical protein